MATARPRRPRRVPSTVQPVGAVSAAIDATIPIPTDTSATPEPDEQAKTRDEKISDFITLCIKRWRTVDSAESVLRKAHKQDLDFFASDQWPDKIRKQRDEDGRPCLTINRLPGFTRQVCNELRESRPGIEVDPVDNGADPPLAEAIMGLVQHIESNSDADTVYDTATEGQARIGRGWFRILPEYADDDSFEQELKLKRIRNPFTVYMDAAYQELDGSDARFCLIVTDLPKDQYIDRYGAESYNSLEQFARIGTKQNDWFPEGKVRVAEVYSFVAKDKTIVRLTTGQVVDETDLLAMQAQGLDVSVATYPDGREMRRTVQGKQLTWALFNGAAILEGNDAKDGPRELPGRWIPVFPVIGEEIDNDGSLDLRGVTRDAIDAQRMSNYWKSGMTERVALANRIPYVIAEGQMEGHEAQWQQANVKNFAALQYKPVAIGGTLVPAPQRNVAADVNIAAEQALSMMAENDLRATAGFSYDVGAHEQRPEQSGKAILARQRQGEIGNAHYQAHLAVALRHAGRVLLDLIPHYYDTPRIKRILGRDGKQKAVIFHAGNKEAADQLGVEQSIPDIFDLSIGRYDVRVKAGVSFGSQRQEDRELMTNTLQAAPQLLPVIGDLYFDSMDSPVARRIAKRMEKALAPGMRDQEDGQQQQIPPELQQQMQQAQQVIDALTQKVNELQDAADTKREELASRERIAQIQADTQISIAESKATTTAQIALLENKMRQIEQMVAIDLQRLGQMNQLAEAEAGRQHQVDMAQLAAGNQAQAADADRQHQAEMAQQDQAFQQQQQQTAEPPASEETV